MGCLETIAEEYTRLFHVLESHRVRQFRAREEQEAWDCRLGWVRSGMGDDWVWLESLKRSIPRPIVPGELELESRRLHELHGLLAQERLKLLREEQGR